MIETKYTLIIETGTETYTYETPDKLKVLNNLSLIEAPNNFGKSTLLHCIALSCYGEMKDFQERFDPGLLEKIKMLYKEPTIKLKFEISIDTEKTTFKAQKKDFDSPRIERTIDGKPTSFENFKEKFDIVYQIPTNPVTRLNGIINDVKSSVSNYKTRLESHDDNLEDIVLNLEKDPKERIKFLDGALEIDGKNLEKEFRLKFTLEKEFKHLEDFTIIKEYNEIVKTSNDLSTELERLMSTEKTKTAKIDSHNQAINNVKTFTSKIELKRTVYIKKVEGLDLDDKKLNDYLDELKALDLFGDFENKTEKFWNYILDIVTIVEDHHEKIVDDEKVKSAGYLKKLKSILDDFPNDFNDSGITDVVNNLLSDVNKYLASTSDEEFDELFKEIFDHKDDILVLVTEGEKVFKRYNALTKKEKIESNVISNQLRIDSLRKQINNLKKPLSKFEDTLEEKEFDPEKRKQFYMWFENEYSSLYRMPLERLKTKKKDKYKILNETNKKIKKIEMSIGRKETEIEELKDKESDEFSNEMELLVEITEIFQVLLTKFTDLEVNLELTTDEQGLGNLQVDETFQHELQKFLALKIPIVPMEQNDDLVERKVTRIDHINKKFITENDEEILFVIYGSGRTSSLAFLSTIKSLSPEKLTILLLDEALMDDTSFEPLINAVNKEYKEGNIFAALFARYSSSSDVMNLLRN
jgi:DNA repair protein SbcC/Rad50